MIKLKKFAVFIFLLSSFTYIAINNSSNKSHSTYWYENLEQAANVAKSQGKCILIDFTGSDWCKWCKKLDGEVLSQSKFIQYAKNNLVLVKIDFPQYKMQSQEVKTYNKRLAATFNVKGYPTVVIMNRYQQVVAYTGYREGGPEKYVQYIKSVLNK